MAIVSRNLRKENNVKFLVLNKLIKLLEISKSLIKKVNNPVIKVKRIPALFSKLCFFNFSNSYSFLKEVK